MSILMQVTTQTALVIGIVAILGIGSAVYFSAYKPIAPGIITTSGSGTTGILGPGGIPAYDCPKPAVNSELLCDILPAGYTIAARLVNAPAAYCLDGMSTTACTLLKQTQSNGVCDSNETIDTSPLDCGCTGALVPDPYTGRCAAPASVCLAQGLG